VLLNSQTWIGQALEKPENTRQYGCVAAQMAAQIGPMDCTRQIQGECCGSGEWHPRLAARAVATVGLDLMPDMLQAARPLRWGSSRDYN
jgi:hypothetical protein